MPFVRTLIQSAFLSSAKPERDGWFVPCDERTVAKASGGTPWPSGVDARLSVRAVYAIVVALVAASCLVGTFSAARDVSWRMGVPDNLWEPALWYCTSGVVVVALLPLARRGAMLARGVRCSTICGDGCGYLFGFRLLGVAHNRHGRSSRTGLCGRRLDLQVPLVRRNPLRVAEGLIQLRLSCRRLLAGQPGNQYRACGSSRR